MLKLDEEKNRSIQTIGNASRLKILLVLWKSDKELTVYKICQRAGLGRSSVACHLHNLVETRLVLKKIYGETPLYAINRDESRARALIDFFAKI